LLLPLTRSQFASVQFHAMNKSVQPRLSTVNAHCCAPCCGAFATERWRLLSIDMSCLRVAQQQTRRTPLLLSNDETDRHKDGRTDARPLRRPCSAYRHCQKHRVSRAYQRLFRGLAELRYGVVGFGLQLYLISFDRLID